MHFILSICKILFDSNNIHKWVKLSTNQFIETQIKLDYIFHKTIMLYLSETETEKENKQTGVRYSLL